tara:strand:+ start:983 stop:1321 length:339 start_codon:yes stop_codon:yes gene_type:complete
MFKSKFIISASIFIFFLIFTSALKNKTRIIEKQISNLKKEILFKEKDVNESQLDYHYLSSPAEIENRLSQIGFDNYGPIKHSNIFFDILHFTKIKNKISNLKIVNEKKIQKK